MGGRGLATDLGHARHVAAVEVRRSVRAVLASRRQLAGFALLILAFAPAGFFLLTGTYAAGQGVREGTTAPVVAIARSQLTVWIASLSALFGLRMVERGGDVDHADLLLTTVSPRAVATGLIAAEFLRVAAVFTVPIALVATSFALGAGTPLVVPVVVVGLLPVLALAVATGFVLGYLVRLGYRRLGWGGLSRSALSMVVVIAIVLGFNVFTPEEPMTLLTGLAPLGAVPVGPYADLLLAPSPVAVTPGIDAAVAALLVVLSIPAMVAITCRIAPTVWYADPIASGQSAEAEAATARFGGVRVPWPLDATRTTRLVWWQWLRGVRAPSQFVHVSYFLFMSIGMVQFVLQHPRSAVVPVFVGVLGALIAGGTFGLNPLGMERSMLPSLLTTPSPGRALVRARLLAGVLLWLPLTLGGVGLIGWYSTLGAAEVGALAAVVVVLTGFSSTLALALGSFSPRFESVQAFGSVEAPTPTTGVLLGHTLLTVLFALFGLLFAFAPGLLNRLAGTGELLVQVGGLAFWTVGAVLVGGLCYRYAVGRMDRFTYE